MIKSLACAVLAALLLTMAGCHKPVHEAVAPANGGIALAPRN